MKKTRNFARALLATSLLAFGLSGPTSAADLPGKGVTVQPVKGSVAEEMFQTLLVSRGLEKLGYTVKAPQETEYATAHLAIANGDATFLPSHWDPLHAAFFQNAGGDAKMWRNSTYVTNAIQGYLIDKKTADKYKITHLGQLSDPKIAALFDTNDDGKADLTGCNPGWGCEIAIESHLDTYHLRGAITHNQGSYSALMADTLARYQQGKPIFYYTWTPYWLSSVLRPSKDVVFLQMPPSAPGAAKSSSQMPDGRDYGFVPNVHRIVANKAFTEKNPAATKLFEVMQLPVADINAQNLRMNDGENKQKDIDRHVDGWIKAHQKTFDSWIVQAMAAAK